jgi:subtilase family serine protease
MDAIYGFSTSPSAGTGTTIAIVDAFDDVNAVADLNGFSAEFGLPLCTTANPCFSKVDQLGGTDYPSTDPSGQWTLEDRLDIEWVHAVAPGAKIVLVETKTDSWSDLLAGDQYAATISDYVSNSWGDLEFSGEKSDDSTFDTLNNAEFFFAAGDQGGIVNYPASAPNVIAVGGTSLKFASGAFSSETAWPRGGGGCSAMETANSAQNAASAAVGCNGARPTPDVSMDADPNSGAAVYNSASGTWSVTAGTSLSTPLMAAASALYGLPINASTLYETSHLPIRDITTGTSGRFPTRVGYDLATGWGSFSYIPGTPTITSAVASGGTVTLTWNPPSGAAVKNYDVFTGTGSSAGNLLASGVTTTTYVAKAPATGQTGYYKVRADNAHGDGLFSPVISATPTRLAASFTHDCSGATCTFTSTSTDGAGVITTYKWIGGNNLTGTTSSISHTYPRPGQYSVQFKVTDSLGATSNAQIVLNCSGATTLTCN